MRAIHLFSFLLVGFSAASQENLLFRGQLSSYSNYAPQGSPDYLLGSRYLPELSYALSPSSDKYTIDFMASANLFGNMAVRDFESTDFDGNVRPYRLWARLTGEQYELRIGLQKIDFGVATVLRPLQWFNQIDSRDPLGITNGVYGILGRYYFLNNANIWLWSLVGNKDTMGFEVIPSNQRRPEFGGRFQFPMTKGEVGLTFHHRAADAESLTQNSDLDKIAENRFGLDAKWDVTIGLWFEASHIARKENLGLLKNQTLMTLGADYTFGLGSGLNVAVEHLIGSSDEKAFQFDHISNTTALTAGYPLGFFDQLSVVSTFSWEQKTGSVFLNYDHQFEKLQGFIMASYNSKIPTQLVEDEQSYSLNGPGIRLMIVYNH